MEIGPVFQIVLAIIIVIVLFIAAFSVYSSELVKEMRTQQSPKQRVDIFKGIKDLRSNNNEVYDTVDKNHPTYKDLSLSINRLGGAEFTYNFWLYKPESGTNSNTAAINEVKDTLETNSDIILLMRGSSRKQAFKNICGTAPTEQNIMVKCPLIKLQKNKTMQNGEMDVLTVELNTQHRPDGVHELSNDKCGSGNLLSTWEKIHGHKLAVTGLSADNFAKKWFMVTVTVRDTNPIDRLPLRNKIQVGIYINGTLEMERYVDNSVGQITSNDASILRQNFGPLYVAPFKVNNAQVAGVNIVNSAANPFYMADLAYYNYGLGPDEIALLYSAGYTKTIAPSISESKANRNSLEGTYDNVSMTDGKSQLKSF